MGAAWCRSALRSPPSCEPCFSHCQPTLVVGCGGGLNHYQRRAADCRQLPLRFSFRQRLTPGVRLRISDTRLREGPCACLTTSCCWRNSKIVASYACCQSSAKPRLHSLKCEGY